MTSGIIQSEIIEWLQSCDERFHGVLADPPYALISIAERFGSDQEPAKAGSDGRYQRLSSGFMGQRWDSFENYAHYRAWVTEWASLLIEKALYPGAVCLFFGGTRTWHHLGVALEDAGFQIVDTMMWLYGAGFPKSHNIGDGYGTALKPAWEPIFVCRAPRGKRTFAELALEYGTGAFWIDGGRIEANQDYKDAGWGPRYRETSMPYMGGNQTRPWVQKAIKRGNAVKNSRSSLLGRWPANLVLTHHEDCIKVGETKVKGRVINRWQSEMKPFGGGAGDEYESEQMPDETAEHWACVSECAVRKLDDQAGELQSGAGIKNPIGGATSWKRVSNWRDSGFYSANSGGPSRFFYTGKANRGEKDLGLENFYWQRTGDGWLRVDKETWESLEKSERARGCIHPTVKPLDLLRYLAKIFKPPDMVKSRLLVPFAGSGSEIIAARQAGWNEVIGIELEENYYEIAQARMAAHLGMFA